MYVHENNSLHSATLTEDKGAHHRLWFWSTSDLALSEHCSETYFVFKSPSLCLYLQLPKSMPNLTSPIPSKQSLDRATCLSSLYWRRKSQETSGLPLDTHASPLVIFRLTRISWRRAKWTNRFTAGPILGDICAREIPFWGEYFEAVSPPFPSRLFLSKFHFRRFRGIFPLKKRIHPAYCIFWKYTWFSYIYDIDIRLYLINSSTHLHCVVKYKFIKFKMHLSSKCNTP